MPLFNRDIFIYQSGFTILGKENYFYQMYIDVIRIAIGLFGSLMVLSVSKLIEGKACIEALFVLFGKHSLGIYVVNTYVNLYVLKVVCANMQFSELRTFFLAVTSTTICLGMSSVIAKCRIANIILLGGR